MNTGIAESRTKCPRASQGCVVMAIFSKFGMIALVCAMAAFTTGSESEASWLARLSHTSVTQMTFSPAGSRAPR